MGLQEYMAVSKDPSAPAEVLDSGAVLAVDGDEDCMAGDVAVLHTGGKPAVFLQEVIYATGRWNRGTESSPVKRARSRPFRNGQRRNAEI